MDKCSHLADVQNFVDSARPLPDPDLKPQKDNSRKDRAFANLALPKSNSIVLYRLDLAHAFESRSDATSANHSLRVNRNVIYSIHARSINYFHVSEPKNSCKLRTMLRIGSDDGGISTTSSAQQAKTVTSK